ncbi:MAG: MFS transporter [Kofleriaceae bacterium]
MTWTRNYRLFVAGQGVSLIGTWTRSVAQGWLVYRLTGSAVWLAVIAACTQVPIVVFASLGGVLADHYRRRSILVMTQSAAMILSFTLAVLAFAGVVEIWQMVLIALAGGVVSAIDMPTRQSFIIEMVGREHLADALSINWAMAMSAASLGPALAGYGVKWLGEGWCFAIDGASFLAVIAGLLAMRDLPAAPAKPTEPFFERIAGGFRFVRGHAEIRRLLSLLAITAFAGLPYATLLPVFARGVFHGDADAFGWLSAANGLGALCGAFVVRRHKRVGLACAVLGAVLVGFALSNQLWLSIALLVPLGLVSVMQIGATNALIQLATPDDLRGRVMAIYSMIVMGFAPMGALVDGAVTRITGPGTPLVVGGVVCLIAALAFVRSSKA